MPLPLLFIGIGAVTSAIGIGKTVKAYSDNSDANDTNERAKSIVSNATDMMEKSRSKTRDALESLGRKKVSVLTGSISDFIAEFEKLKNVEFADSLGLEELNKLTVGEHGLGELKRMQSAAQSLASGAAGAAGAALVSAGACGFGATALGTASTGTAISALSGAAATNATLAFFGGGSLAAGGLGVAGGTYVLGGLIAGPALAVMGCVLGSKASANKDRAYSNLAKAREYKEQMELACDLCEGISEKANMFNSFLSKLNSLLVPLVTEMGQIINLRGTNFKKFSPLEQKTVAKSVALAKSVKSIVDTPILTPEGKLTSESSYAIDSEKRKLLEAQVNA